MPRSLRQLAEEEMLSHSETDSPRSLLDWCCQQIAANPHIIGELAQLDERLPCVYQLHPNLFFPALVSQELLEAFRQQYALVGLDCRLLSLFENAKSTPLFSLNLSGSRTGDTMFSRLLNGHAHELEMINLTDCTELTEGKIPNVVMPKLLTLNLGDLIGLFADWTPARCSTQRRSSDLNCSSEESRNGQTETVTKNSDAESEAEFSPNKHSSVPDFMDDNSNATLMDFDDTSVSSSDDFLLVKRRQLYGDGDWLSFEYSGEQEKLSMPPRNDKVDVVDERMCQQCDEEFGSSSSSSGTRPPNILSQKRRCRLLTSSDLNSVPKSFLTHLCPNLIALTLHGSTWDEVFPDPPRNNTQISFLTYFLGPLGSLEYLDLSYWQQLEDLRFLRPQLSHSVTSLILYNVPDLYRAMDTLCDMKALIHLDISQAQLETGTYPQPVTQLHRIVTSLTKLKSLDISSTNLPSVPGPDDWPIKEGNSLIPSDIVGLRSLSAPLHFLGLFNCDIASHYAQLPAEQVTGDFNEAQVLLSLERYINRAEMMQRALNEAYQVYRNGGASQHVRALRIVAAIMERHPSVPDIQICSSAALFYILKCVSHISFSLKRRVVETFLSSMETHADEHVLVRNCCLSLCQFEIPADILFNYRRAVNILLRVLRDHGHDPTTQRIVVFLLNSMACHVEGEQKVAVGDMGAVEQICDLISQRLANNICDEVMEVSWSFLWNITDETAANCERFLNARGMDLFHGCYKTFTDKDELIRNMMGLMGNLAEVRSIRSQLLSKDYLEVFCKLLENFQDGIEISYNSAGVIAHLLSDCPTSWPLVKPTIEEVTVAVVNATKGWKLEAQRFINYRSFAPILRLIGLHDCIVSQHWGVWALANLTTVDGKKYCKFVRDEGGIPLLQEIIQHPKPSAYVKYLAKIVLDNVAKWQKRAAQPNYSKAEDEDMEA